MLYRLLCVRPVRRRVQAVNHCTGNSAGELRASLFVTTIVNVMLSRLLPVRSVRAEVKTSIPALGNSDSDL